MGILTGGQSFTRAAADIKAPLTRGLLGLALLLAILQTLLLVSPASADDSDSPSSGPVIMVIGDSLSAAYGLAERQGWVSLAKPALSDTWPGVQMVNASISGDTTAGGLRRLPAALERFEPDLVIIELGGNDGLRGYPIDSMRDNLIGMAKAARESGAITLIFGMMIPSNYGPAYTEAFSGAFAEAADATDAMLLPFFLEPIAMDRSYFQRDGIHPTAEAQPLLLEHALPLIEQALEQSKAL